MNPAAHVLLPTDHPFLGGGETSWLHLLAALRTLAPQLRLLAICPAPGPVAERAAALDIPVRHIAYPRQFRRGPLPWFSFSARAQFIRLAREAGAALLHANGLFGMLYGGAAARALGRPCLWTCHGWYEVDNLPKRLAARHLPQRIACVSAAVSAAVGAHVPPARVSVDYLGIPPFEDQRPREAIRAEVRAELGIDQAAPLLAVVGRFQPVKGHHHLLAALPAVLRRIPNLHTLLIGDAVAGDAVELAQKARIVELIARHQLEHRVRLLGFRPDARRLLRALDLLVIPSERETFSMVAVEGLEAGIPVLGPNRDGPAEIITPGCGGFFTPGDAASLAEGIINLLLDPRAMGFTPAAGPTRFAAEFTSQAHARRVLAEYARLAPQLPLPSVPGAA